MSAAHVLPGRGWVYEPLPSARKFHQLRSRYKGFSGPVGCIAGETVIDNPMGESLTVEELYRRGIAPMVQTVHGPAQAGVPFIKGTDDLYELKLTSGESFLGTLDHLLFGETAFRPLREFSAGAAVRLAATSDIRWSEVASVDYAKTDVFYDLTVPGVSHYFAHGMIHHNSGKSFAFGYEALFAAYLNPRLMGLIGAPTYPMLRDATQRTFFEIMDMEEIDYSYMAQDKKVTLKDNGSEIIFRTLDDPEKLRGPNLAWFGVDELTYCKPDAWGRLEARLRDPKANRLEGFAAWTPNGFDVVYDQWIGDSRIPGYDVVLASPRENFYVANTGMYDRLAASYDERLYKQEVLGEYLAVNAGQAYYAFSRGENVRAINYDPTLPIIWSLDFNYNPMCSVIAQVQDYQDYRFDADTTRALATINVLEEMYLANTATAEACQEFHRRMETYRRPGFAMNVEVYGDATGSARHAAGDPLAPSDWLAVKAFFQRHANEYKVAFKYRPSNPFQRDRVAAVNGKLCNVEGTRTLFVDPGCKNLIRDLEQVVWKEGSGNLDQTTDPKLTHISDAAGYLCETRFGTRSNGGPRTANVVGR